ncbi:MAG: DUF4118 domain-containing protein [Ectothiorhodospiraceae bacterium]|nr:DUF4118 domain-containing protein [Chromatiales bacterium]MCP5154551.1 DUF4118 domain-containing protein [Ectothiorhodospiraceae bacterium]
MTLRDLVLATLAVAAATCVGLAFQRLPPANLSLVYLVAVLGVATRLGLWPSIYACITSFLLYNFLFTPPYLTFTVEHEGDLATLVLYLVVATVTGHLAARARAENATSQAALERTQRLYAFTHRLAAAGSDSEAARTLAGAVHDVVGDGVVVALAGARSAGEHATAGAPEPALVAAVEAALDGPAPSTVGHHTLIALTADARVQGLASMRLEGADADTRQLVHHLCEQTAAGLARLRLARDLEEARVTSETERLRASLLSSVSHDLRTPLASIAGATSTVLEYGDGLTPAVRRDLIESARREAQRMDRYIQNLIDMTRLDQGKIRLARDWVDLHDLVGSAIERCEREHPDVRVEVDIAADAALLDVHGTMLEQALVNLLDNAMRVSPAGLPVVVRARTADDSVVLEVVDRGPGIPPSDRQHVFEAFFSRRGDGRQGGVGLGLAIVAGVVAAHGGTVRALAGDDGVGTCMRIVLPRAEPAP